MIRKTLKSSLIPANEIPLLYLSPNKVQAMQDCIQFCPQLFRLSKSIVISEPLVSFRKYLDQRLGQKHSKVVSMSLSKDKRRSAYLSSTLKKVENDQLGDDVKRKMTLEKLAVRRASNMTSALGMRKTLLVLDKNLEQQRSTMKRSSTSVNKNRKVTFRSIEAANNAPDPHPGDSARSSKAGDDERNHDDDNYLTDEQLQNMDWVQNIKDREKSQLLHASRKPVAARRSALIFNYGVM